MAGSGKNGPMMKDDAGNKGWQKMEGMHKGMMMKCHHMMEARLDVMEKMMDQMLEHEAAEQQMERAY